MIYRGFIITLDKKTDVLKVILNYSTFECKDLETIFRVIDNEVGPYEDN